MPGRPLTRTETVARGIGAGSVVRISFQLEEWLEVDQYQLEVRISDTGHEDLVWNVLVPRVALARFSRPLGEHFFQQLLERPAGFQGYHRPVLGHFAHHYADLFGDRPSRHVTHHPWTRPYLGQRERFQPSTVERWGYRSEAPLDLFIPTDRDPFFGFNCNGEIRRGPELPMHDPDRATKPKPLGPPNKRLPVYGPTR